MEVKSLITLVLSILSVAASLVEYIPSQIDDIKMQEERNIQSTAPFSAKDFENIMRCLSEQVPEIFDEWADYVADKSEGKAYIEADIANFNTYDVYRDYGSTEYLGKYYLIYVGEEWEDHRVNWAWFYISESFDEVLWYDRVAGKDSEYRVLYLDEWRNSDFYPKLNEW